MVTLLQLKEALKEYDTLASELDLNALDATYSLESDNCEVDLDSFQSDDQSYIDESVQIIYHANAIDYLAKNDPSLYNSLEIAHEYGFETQSLNSELLASLLLQRECCDELGELINELEGL